LTRQLAGLPSGVRSTVENHGDDFEQKGFALSLELTKSRISTLETLLELESDCESASQWSDSTVSGNDSLWNDSLCFDEGVDAIHAISPRAFLPPPGLCADRGQHFSAKGPDAFANTRVVDAVRCSGPSEAVSTFHCSFCCTIQEKGRFCVYCGHQLSCGNPPVMPVGAVGGLVKSRGISAMTTLPYKALPSVDVLQALWSLRKY